MTRSRSGVTYDCEKRYGYGDKTAWAARNAEIVRRVQGGESQASVARSFGMTRQRVGQIVRGRRV